MKTPLNANVALLVASLLCGSALLEVGYRAALFSDHAVFEPLRKPGDLADYYSDDDYWKLYYRFGGPVHPPADPHPVLGWTGSFSGSTYLHDDAVHVGHRRPVLLFGDSFAACVGEVSCFEDLLNGDSTFAEGHHLLNYGVGGYGTDQILLLLKRAVDHFDDPLVIVGVMTLDLDRSVLSVRTGPKPYFTLDEGELRLRGVPIGQDPREYFSENPPSIRSYVYRRIVHSGLLPGRVAAYLRREAVHRQNKLRLNEAIIETMVSELRARDLEHVFLVFHPPGPDLTASGDGDDWRGAFLERSLADNGVPTIWSRDAYQRDGGDRRPDDRYFLPNDGHPTGYFNGLIAQDIKQYVLASKRGPHDRR